MAAPVRKLPQDSLYERDFYTWTKEQGARLRARAHNDIDWENVAEEIESLGRSERRELAHRLEILIAHLLKWRHQPELRGRSWSVTIANQRHAIQALLKESPSLKPMLEAMFLNAYPDGARRAAEEAWRFEGDFPASPPFDLDEALDESFLPDDLDSTQGD